MLLLFADALLLFFITTSLGAMAKRGLEKIFREPIDAGLPGIFLTGLVCSTVYFNILSFWRPVNYLSLLPLFFAALLFLIRNYRRIRTAATLQLRTLSAPPYIWAFGCFIILLLCYWALPPMNMDSADYHNTGIQWYESYKVIPGLANIHGRYAFDSAAFIIQAAYAFSPLTGLAIFPLNGVLTALLLGWLLVRSFQNRASFTGLVYLILLGLFARPLLINISSPSSDSLVMVCIAYSVVRLFEILLTNTIRLSNTLIPLLILLYAPVAKLSAYTAWLFLPYLLFILPEARQRWSLVRVMTVLAVLLYIPWLGRNYLMSGYLVYPLPYLDHFNPDWKVPKDVLLLDYYYIRYGAMLYPLDTMQKWDMVRSVPFYQWFPYWLSAHFIRNLIGNLGILLPALFSPLAWAAFYFRDKKPDIILVIFWIILYGCVWIWILTSAEYRFGMIYLPLAIALPLLYLFQNKELKGQIANKLIPLLFAVCCGYYFCSGINRHLIYRKDFKYGFSLKNNWLLPLPNYRTTINNDLSGFPYKVLNSGIRLYLSDSTHECLNAPLPCMSWKYGEVQMRGSRMEDGFRNVKDEVRKDYPFIK